MQGAARKDHAILGLVREFHALGRAGKDHAVLAHNGSATQGRKTDVTAFARGALHAARWARTQKPGLYSMMDVLGLKDF